MILYGISPGNVFEPVTTASAENRSALVATYHETGGSTSGTPQELTVADENAASYTPSFRSAAKEEFDWLGKKTRKEFARMEQKFLAEVAGNDEKKRYLTMKRDRDAKIFGNRQVQDYREIRRLRQLEKKLAEIQKFIQPINCK
jgi:hypothetical protein